MGAILKHVNSIPKARVLYDFGQLCITTSILPAFKESFVPKEGGADSSFNRVKENANVSGGRKGLSEAEELGTAIQMRRQDVSVRRHCEGVG